MRERLQANLLFGGFHALFRPGLHRFPAEMPHLLDQSLFGRIRGVEIAGRILYYLGNRRDSVAKYGMRVDKSQNRFIAQFIDCHK